MLLLHYGRPSVCTVRMMSEMLTPLSDSRHTKAEGKFTPQICRSRIFVPANECTRVVPMYPSQSAMSHLHSLAQSMYIATFLPKHVIPTCFADYVTSTSGATRLAFDLSPWPQVILFFQQTVLLLGFSLRNKKELVTVSGRPCCYILLREYIYIYIANMPR